MKSLAPGFLKCIRRRRLGIFLLLLAPVLIYCLTRPVRQLPAPIVALNFIKWGVAGTNQVAVFSFTNMGQTEVCLWDSIQLWRLVAETPRGRVTNMAPFATVAGERVPPGAQRGFAVPIIPGTTRWQVSTIYGYQMRRSAASEFRAWVWRSWLVQRSPEPISAVVSWCLDLLPEPPHPEEREVCSPVFTNLPPPL